MWAKPGVVEWSKEKAGVVFGKPFSWDIQEREEAASKGWWSDKSEDGERMVRATAGRGNRQAQVSAVRLEGIT